MIVKYKIDVTNIVDKLKYWQENMKVNTFRCQEDNSHGPLIIDYEIVEGGWNIYMKCPKCNFKRDHIPEFIQKTTIEELEFQQSLSKFS